SAQSADEIDAAPLAFACERKVAAIRRPDWVEIRRGVGRQLQRLSGAYQFDPDVVIILLRAIPGESDLRAVGRNGRQNFAARITGKGHDLQPGAGAFVLRPS